MGKGFAELQKSQTCEEKLFLCYIHSLLDGVRGILEIA